MIRRGAWLFVIPLIISILFNVNLAYSDANDGKVCCYQPGEATYCQYLPAGQCSGPYDASLNTLQCAFKCSSKDCCLDSCSDTVTFEQCTPGNFELGGNIGCDNPYGLTDYQCDLGCCVYYSGNQPVLCKYNAPPLGSGEGVLRKDCSPDPPNSDSSIFYTGLLGDNCVKKCNSTYTGPQYGNISGYVKNNLGNLIGANVEISSNGIISINNPYLLKNIPAGTRSVTASAFGYLSKVQTVNVEVGKQAVLNFTLENSIVTIGNVEGYVKNSVSSQPVALVNVSTNCEGCSTMTDTVGHYLIQNIPTGTSIFTAKKDNFETKQITFTVTQSTKQLNFSITPLTAPKCGNNIKEENEECDGTASTNCPNKCMSTCLCPTNCNEANGYCTDFKFQCTDANGYFITPFGKNLCSNLVKKEGCCNKQPIPIISCLDNNSISSTTPQGSGNVCYCKYEPGQYRNFSGSGMDPGYCCDGKYKLTKCLTPGIFKGTVKNETSFLPIKDAKVIINDQEAITDIAGNFRITGVSPGVYTASASHPSFRTKTKEVTINSGGETITEFLLSPINFTCLQDTFPSPTLKFNNIKGKPYIKLVWSQICRGYIANFFVYKLINSEFEPIGAFTDKYASTFIDTNNKFDTCYTYKLGVLTEDNKFSFSNPVIACTGNSLCEDNNNEFCLDRYDLLNFPKVKRMKCDDANKAYLVDNKTESDCSNAVKWPPLNGKSAICLEENGKTYCKYPENCPELGIQYVQYLPNINVLGLYYGDTYKGNTLTCEKNLSATIFPKRYCYKDYYSSTFLPNTIADKCINCDQQKSCFDYNSEYSCTTNNCLFKNCKWYATTSRYSEFGRGLCFSENYTGTDKCDRCSQNNNIFSNVECSPDVCRKLGSCYASADRMSCKSCSEETKCEDLIDEQGCIGTNPIKFAGEPQINGTSCGSSTIIVRSDDSCSLGTCKWVNSACIKDGNLDGSPDEGNGNDNSPPNTTIYMGSEPYLNSEGLTIYINILDNPDSSGAKTFYCVSNKSCCPTKEAENNQFFLSKTDFGEVEGIFNIYYYSVDSNNNVEEIKSRQIYINTKSPEISISYHVVNMTNAEFTSKLFINISANKNSYCTDELIGPYYTSSQGFKVSPNKTFEAEFDNSGIGLSDGSYTYTISCTDIYSNLKEQSFNINIDRIQLIYNKLPNSTISETYTMLYLKTKFDQLYCRYFLNNEWRLFNPDQTGEGTSDGGGDYEYIAYESFSDTKIYNLPVECYDGHWDDPSSKIAARNNLYFALDRKGPLTTIINANTNKLFDQTSKYQMPNIRLDCDDRATFNNTFIDAFNCTYILLCIDDNNICDPDNSVPPSFTINESLGSSYPFYQTGTYHLRYRSIDTGDNLEDINSVIVNIDQDSPLITLTYPPENFVTDQQSVNVRGEISENTTFEVYARIRNMVINASITNKQFSVDIPLNPGDNLIEVYSIDSSQNIDIAETIVYRDNIGPKIFSPMIFNSDFDQIQDIHPNNFAEYKQSPIIFNLTAYDEEYSSFYQPFKDDTPIVDLKVSCISNICGNDSFIQNNLNSTDYNYAYYHSTPLKVGNYSVNYTAKDRFNNPTFLSQNFSVRDTTPPIMNISIWGNVHGSAEDGFVVGYGIYDIIVSSTEPITITYLNFTFLSGTQNKQIYNIVAENQENTLFRGKMSIDKSDSAYQNFNPQGEIAYFDILAHDINNNFADSNYLQGAPVFLIDIIGPSTPILFDPPSYNLIQPMLRRVVTKYTPLMITGSSYNQDPSVKINLYNNNLPNIDPDNLDISMWQRISSKQVLPIPSSIQTWSGQVVKLTPKKIQLNDWYNIFQIGQNIEMSPYRYNLKYYRIADKKLDRTTPNEKFYNITMTEEIGETLDFYQTISIFNQTQIGPQGWFDFNPSMTEGVNNFIIYPEDELGNIGESSDIYQVILDTINPSNVDKFPAHNSIIGDDNLRIKIILDGTGSEINGLAIYLSNDVDREYIPPIYEGMSQNKLNITTSTLPLEQGKYQVEVFYLDEAGNNNTDKWNFSIDTSAPRTPKASPSGIINNPKPPITIEFNETESIELDNVTIFSTTRSFEKDITDKMSSTNKYSFNSMPTALNENLIDDTYILYIKAKKVVDLATGELGSEAEFYPQFEIDTTPPIILTLENSQGLSYKITSKDNEDAYLVTNEEAECRWDYSNKPFLSMQSNHNFSTANLIGNAMIQPLTPGNNTYYVLCKDMVNNIMTNHSTITFYYDNVVPSLIVNYPKNNEIFMDQEIQVRGSSELNAEISLFVNGQFQQKTLISSDPQELIVYISGNKLLEDNIQTTIGSSIIIANADEVDREIKGYANKTISPGDYHTLIFNEKGEYTLETVGVNSNTLNIKVTDKKTDFSFNTYLFFNQSNEIIVKATDSVNNYATKVISVKHDGQIPTINKLTPWPDSITNNLRTTISAEYSDENGINISTVRLEIDNTPIASNKLSITNGRVRFIPYEDWSLDIHNVFVELKDNAGNLNSISWQFMVDLNVPTLIGFYKCGSGVEFEDYGIVNTNKPCFYVQYKEDVTLQGINSKFKPVDGTSKWFIFNSTTAMPEDYNEASLTVEDEFGNQNTDALHFIIDTIKPIINDKTDTSLTNTQRILVEGAIDDRNTDYLIVNGDLAGLTGNDYSIELPLILNNGNNTFVIIAVDKAGNYNSLNISIPTDRIKPYITGLSLSPSLTNDKFTVIFNSSEQLSSKSINVENNGADLGGTSELKSSTANTNTYLYTIPAGEFSNYYDVIIKITDNAGNSFNLSIPIGIDTMPPEIKGVVPSDGEFTNELNPMIGAEYEDWIGVNASSVVLKVNGIKVTNSDGQLYADENTITYIPNSQLEDMEEQIIFLQLSDIVGNIKENTWKFRVDTSAPSTPSFKPGQYTSNNKPQIEANFSDNEVIRIQGVLLNENSILATELNSNIFTYTPATPLNNGNNGLIVYAEKQLPDGSYGTLGQYNYEFIVDSIIPELSIEAASEYVNTNKSRVIINYYDYNMDSIEIKASLADIVYINTINMPIDHSPFGYDIPLDADGEYTITVKATDKAQNSVEKTIKITRNTESPLIQINSVDNPSTIINGSSYITSIPYMNIEGTISYPSMPTIEGTMVIVHLNEVEKDQIVVDESGEFIFNEISPLQIGLNTITLKAISPAGTPSETSIKIVYTTQEPKITLINPITRTTSTQIPLLSVQTDQPSVCNLSYIDNNNIEYSTNFDDSLDKSTHDKPIQNTNQLKIGQNVIYVECKNEINLAAKEIFVIDVDQTNPQILDVNSAHGDATQTGDKEKSFLLFERDNTNFTIKSNELVRCWYGSGTSNKNLMNRTNNFDDAETAYKFEHKTSNIIFGDNTLSIVNFICEDKAGNAETYKANVNVQLFYPMSILSKKPDVYTNQKRPTLEVVTDRNADCYADKSAGEGFFAFIFDKIEDIFKIGNVLMEKRTDSNNHYVHTANLSSKETYPSDLEENTLYLFDIECIPIEQGILKAYAQIIFKTDFTPPLIEITEPSNGYISDNPIINIKGLVSPDSYYELFVNGISQRREQMPPSTMETMPFSTTSLIYTGVNTITATAYDQINNSKSSSISVIFANTGPVVEWIFPNNGDIIESLDKISVKIKSMIGVPPDLMNSDIQLFDLQTNQEIYGFGTRTTDTNTNTIEIIIYDNLKPISDGTYKIIVIPKDINGKKGEPKISIFNIDSSVPLISLEAPLWYGGTYTKSSITFKGSISSSNNLGIISGKILVDNVEKAQISQSFSRDIAGFTKEGVYTFRIEATANNKKAVKNGYLVIDTKGPETCIIINDDMTCYTEPINVLNPNVCNNKVCEIITTSCLSDLADCTIKSITGLSNLGSIELSPQIMIQLFLGSGSYNIKKAYQTSYSNNDGYQSAYVALFDDKTITSSFLNDIKDEKQLTRKNQGTQIIYSSSNLAIWQSNNFIIVVQTYASSINEDLIKAYISKFPSTLT